MEKRSVFKDIVKFVIFIGIAVLIVWLFWRQLSPEEISQMSDSFRNANYWWLLPALGFGVLSHILRAWRWRMLLYPLGYKPKMWNMIFSVSIAYFANLAIPRIGEVARCGILAKYEKIPLAKSLGTVITERAIDMITFFLLFVINLFVQRELAMTCLRDIISNGESPNPTKWIVIISVFVALLAAVILWMRYVRKHHINNKLVNKVVDTIKGFADGIKSMVYVKSPFMLILSSLLIWVCYMYMSKMMFYCLPGTARLGYDAAISGLAFCTIGTILLPGGIGLYPVLASAIYSLYGVESGVGFALGWMIWANQTVIVIIAGIISLIILPIYNKTDHDSSITATENTDSQAI
ncbi:MAG: flippase-like domain-containing protein [Bacteroidales bacterium]|nr:flippase-like domain-containing protein [Bacteroidales bacterium]